jgi:hypothetical protein
MARDARLSILTAQEVDELYRLPRFTEADRGLYFDLSTAELKLVDDVVTRSLHQVSALTARRNTTNKHRSRRKQIPCNECRATAVM